MHVCVYIILFTPYHLQVQLKLHPLQLTVHPSTILQTLEEIQDLCLKEMASSRNAMAETLKRDTMNVSCL